MSESNVTIPTGAALTALDPTFREQPHDVLDKLRVLEPVHRDREFDRVMLTRADDVEAVLNDRSLGTDPRKSRPGSFSRVQLGVDEKFQPSMLHMDDPDHKRLRGLVSKAFNQASIDAMRTRIGEIANRLLDEIPDPGRFDVVEAYAKPLPTIVIAAMLGVDETDQRDFKRWSDAQVHLFNPLRTAEQVASLEWGRAALKRYFLDAIAERRKERKNDIISTLISAEEAGEKLSEMEIITVCQTLLIAGNITTTDLIGNGILALLQNPDQLDKLCARPALTHDAIEEILRYDPPVVQSNRVASRSREIGGLTIEAGQTVTLSLLAANHDPAAHHDPHRFDVERTDKHHSSFGGGTHFCLGAPLARAEAQIAIPMVFARFPRLHLASGYTPIHKSLPSFNGLESLWVESRLES